MCELSTIRRSRVATAIQNHTDQDYLIEFYLDISKYIEINSLSNILFGLKSNENDLIYNKTERYPATRYTCIIMEEHTMRIRHCVQIE